MSKFRSPEAMIREIMGGKATSMPLDESIAAATLHNTTSYEVDAALALLKSNGVDCAKKVDDTTISIGACHAETAATVLNNAVMHGNLKSIPKLVSANAIAPQPGNVPVTNPVKEDVNTGDELDRGQVDLKTGNIELEARTLHNRKENQLKKIDEEQIDEISRDTASRYINKTKGDESRAEGRSLALKKKWGDKKFGTEEPKVKATEEVEHVTEISKKTLGSYLKKSSEEDNHHATAVKTQDPAKFKKSMNRLKGVHDAADKINGKAKVNATEEVVNEISKKTLASYIPKAADSAMDNNHDQISHMRRANKASAAGDEDKADHHDAVASDFERKVENRRAGIRKAVKKLQEAIQTISEAGFDAKADAAAGYTHHIVDGHTKSVVGRAKNLRSALTSVDKRNNKHGSYRYSHRRIADHDAHQVDARIKKAGLGEEVEHIEELSKGTLRDYLAKSDKSRHKAFMSGDKKTYWKRTSGQQSVAKKLDEEVEQVDELSNKTLNGYVKKAAGDVADRAHYHTDPHNKKILKNRQAGIKTATNKVMGWNEEVEQVDEVSKETLKSYLKKSTKSFDHHSDKADDLYMDHAGDKHIRKATNRHTGMGRAAKKLKEDINEGKKEDEAAAEKSAKKFAAHPRADAMHADMIHATKHYNYVQDATDHVYTNNMKHVKYADWHEMKPHIENHFREHGLED